MNTTIQEESRGQHIAWSTGIVSGLLLISLGLELLAHQVFGRTDLGTLLWALYFGFWSFVLGATGSLLLTVQWVVEWRRVDRHKKTMNVPKGLSQPLSNSGAVNQNRTNAEPHAQAREPETAVTYS